MTFAEVLKQKYGKEGHINDYLSVQNNLLFYKEMELLNLVKTYGEPLEVAYTEIINERIRSLKSCFAEAARTFGYSGKFLYAYASKANYYSEVLASALDSVDALEVTS